MRLKVTVETKTKLGVLDDCRGVEYCRESDSLRITKDDGKEIIVIPYREIIHYTMKWSKE